jgi:predicted NUDIX family NTP pyrophosphohydrolase
MYRRREGGLEVLLVHPGGPYWSRRDRGAWSIPKGEYGNDEDPLAAARREFAEETGLEVDGPFASLGTLRQPGGKIVDAWALEGDCNAEQIRSNTFEMEWPPRSGRRVRFPEIDRGAWFDLDEARSRILPGQRGFLEELGRRLK